MSLQRRRVRIAFVLSACLASVLLAACAGRNDGGDEGGGGAVSDRSDRDSGLTGVLDERLFVTGDKGSLPEGCSVTQVGLMLFALFDGLDAADLDAIDRAFASGDLATGAQADEIGFQWYTMTVDGVMKGPGGAVQLILRSGLGPYFSERVTRHERMRLLVFDVRGQEGLPSTAGGSLVVARAADDLPGEAGEKIAHGKYAVNCGTGTVYALSLATDTSAQVSDRALPGSLCPLPKAWQPRENTTIGCVP